MRKCPFVNLTEAGTDDNTPACLLTSHEYQGRPEQSVRDITNLLTEREFECSAREQKKPV